MKEKDAIKIRSSLFKEIITKVVVSGKKYMILTEDLNPANRLITTNLYLGGKIISTRNIDCSTIMNKPDSDKIISELIHRQHETILETLRKEQSRRSKTPSDYLDEVKDLLQRKNKKAALEILMHALKKYPDDPFLLSYYGCLETVVNKNYSYGIGTCARAIEMLNDKMTFGREIYLPTFYLNLGRAHLASGKKHKAINSFQKGLSYNRENKDLLWEVKKIGIRRTPVIPYLQRSNPINKYIGIMRHKLSKAAS